MLVELVVSDCDSEDEFLMKYYNCNIISKAEKKQQEVDKLKDEAALNEEKAGQVAEQALQEL